MLRLNTLVNREQCESVYYIAVQHECHSYLDIEYLIVKRNIKNKKYNIMVENCIFCRTSTHIVLVNIYRYLDTR